MTYSVIKKYKTLELIKLSEPINNGLYSVRCNKAKKAKNGLSLKTAIEVFYNCIN
jgi:hypothetical protein